MLLQKCLLIMCKMFISILSKVIVYSCVYSTFVTMETNKISSKIGEIFVSPLGKGEGTHLK